MTAVEIDCWKDFVTLSHEIEHDAHLQPNTVTAQFVWLPEHREMKRRERQHLSLAVKPQSESSPVAES